MKRNLCLLLALVMAVGGLFVPSVTSAAATAATSVVVVASDGAETTLDSSNTTLGGLNFSNGTLTMQNVTGIQSIRTDNGNLTVDVRGSNTIGSVDTSSVIQVDSPDATLTIQGDGTLTATAKNHVIRNMQGDITVAGSVKLNLTAANSGGIRTGTNVTGKNIIFKDNCRVTINVAVYGIDQASSGGYCRITDRASIKINASPTAEWGIACRVNNLRMDGGSLDINIKSGITALEGLNVTGMAYGINKKAGSVKMTGGTLTIHSESTLQTAQTRAYAIYGQDVDVLEFSGTAKVEATTVNPVGAGEGEGSVLSSVIGLQGKDYRLGAHTVRIAENASVTLNGDDNTYGLIDARDMDGESVLLSMEGGALTGFAAYAFAPNAGGRTVNILGGTVDVSAKLAVVRSAASPILNVGKGMTVSDGALSDSATVFKAAGPAYDPDAEPADDPTTDDTDETSDASSDTSEDNSASDSEPVDTSEPAADETSDTDSAADTGSTDAGSSGIGRIIGIVAAVAVIAAVVAVVALVNWKKTK